MGRKKKIAAIALVVLGTLMAGVAYAWDRSAADRIAEGVTIGGVDVGELTRSEALATVRREVAKPLQKAVVVTRNEAKFELSPERAKLRIDAGEMVDSAFEASEEGSLISRTWRRVTGSEVDESIAATPVWSQKRVEDFVTEVAEAVNRAPRDATIEPAVGSLARVHSSAGVEIRQDELAEAISSEIGSGSTSTIEAPADRVRPAVRTRDLAAQYPHYLTVDKAGNVLRYFSELKLVSEYPVSVGLPQYPTPTGLFSIANKQVDPVWSVPNSDWAGELAGTVVAGGTAENPLRARWMGITDGVGIHGTTAVANLGAAASHGCIRMSVPEVIALYDAVPVGTPIYIS